MILLSNTLFVLPAMPPVEFSLIGVEKTKMEGVWLKYIIKDDN
jgi:hypothetical protein